MTKKRLQQITPYVFAVVLYAVWIIGWNTFPGSATSYHDCVLGKISSALIGKLGYTRYHLSSGSWALLSPFLEVKMLFGPGFFAGFIIGLTRVRSVSGTLKGLIPPVLFWTCILPLMLMPQGIFTALYALPLFIVTVPYSIIGAGAGWFSSLYLKFGTINTK